MMNALKTAIEHIKLPEEFDHFDIWEAIRKDEEALNFIKENKEADKLTNAAILKSNANLYEYVTQKGKSPLVEPQLIIHNGIIEVTYVPRNARIQKVIQSGGSRFIYDPATRKYKGLTMQDYKVTKANQAAVSQIVNFIKNYEEKDSRTGMWLNGYFGVGKTYLMGCFAGELKKELIDFTFIEINQWLTNLKRLMQDKGKFDAMEEKTSQANILMIDDLGSERMTDWVFDRLNNLFNYRMQNDLPTFVTSNLMKKEYIDRLQASSNLSISLKDIDRFRERMDYLTKGIEMTGKNKRKKADQLV